MGNAATGNLIGLFVQGAGSFIQRNVRHGVWIEHDDALRNVVSGNSTARNGGLGIKLGPGDLPTPNDVGDADTGANNLQNHPVLGAAALDDPADELLVSFTLPPALPNDIPVGIDLYVTDADGEEGVFWIGRQYTDGTDGGSQIASFHPPSPRRRSPPSAGRSSRSRRTRSATLRSSARGSRFRSRVPSRWRSEPVSSLRSIEPGRAAMAEVRVDSSFRSVRQEHTSAPVAGFGQQRW